MYHVHYTNLNHEADDINELINSWLMWKQLSEVIPVRITLTTIFYWFTSFIDEMKLNFIFRKGVTANKGLQTGEAE